MAVTLVGFIGMVAIVACGGPNTPTPQTKLSVTRLASPALALPIDSGIATETISVIKDQPAWESFWKAIYANQSPAPPLPAVDFSKEMIVIAAAGQKPSSGYSMQIMSAVEDKGEVTVTVEATSPGRGCVGLTVMTSPVDIARLPRRDTPVRFEVVRRTRPC